jgi:polar amino acid transport system substrate-binding protein
MRKSIFRGLGIVLAITLFPLTGFAADPKPLTIAISNWAPYKDENLPEGGIVTDITKKALIRAGYDVSITVVPWKRALLGTIVGKYDVIPAIWLNPERAEKLNFGDAIITSRMVIVSRGDYNFQFQSLESLRGETVGVAAGWGYPEAFQKADYFIKDEALDLMQSLRKLIFGRIKLAIVEEFASRYTVNAHFKDAVGTLNYSKVALQKNDLHVAFTKNRPDHEEIKNRFNAALASMKEDGSFQKILAFHGVQSATN